MTLTATGDGAVLDHPGLLYDSRARYLSAVTGFVREAVGAGEAVLVAVPPPNLAALRETLTDVAGQVTFADMTVAGRNPGRIIPGVLLAFLAAHPGRRVSIVGEPVWPGRTNLEYPACAAHEALINVVFAARDVTILCPYDVGRLDPARVRDAWRTHPVMIVDGARRPSPWYDDPYATAATFNQPLPKVPVTAATLTYRHATDLAAVRRFVTAEAGHLDPDRGGDLLIAVNELAENTIAHTGGDGTVSIWTEAGRLVCQIDDHGCLADPLAGRIPPPPDAEGGRGLLLANRLCDLVRVHTGPDGTSIRLHMGL
ncbi:sensor histidine kinase [Actinoplanes flavus]|uniref:Sensor histidine kinase n=1 Tax=Actinoplanes flavus TaxID=2820290 RepID=A0ABS3UV61_9ACTN|nr:sensor histidine kinase [Actinoplanes flavus]MBO3742490.1 sensor histidine kinase [Actinoplanes flavus]